MRVTRKQVESMFVQVVDLASSVIPGARDWKLDYAANYGGYTISYGGKYLGGEIMGANRMNGACMYQMLRTLRDIFETQLKEQDAPKI